MQHEVNEQWGSNNEKNLITQYQTSTTQGYETNNHDSRFALPKSKCVLKLESLLKSN